jgi:subtilisin family serine protease
VAIFDPRLQVVQLSATASQQVVPYAVLWNRRFSYYVREQQPRVRVLLHFEGSLDGAIGAGFQPSSTSGPIAAGSIAISDLPALQDAPFVTFVESSRPLLNELDLSIADIGASQIWAHPPGNRGANVIIGIIDSGIDYHHPSFCDSAGATRILAIWDQTLTPHAALSESSPSGFAYGVEFDKAAIDAELAGGAPIRHVDKDGHGTHVAGIAAGNGLSAKTYVGVAPEADIMVVASNPVTNLGDSANTLDAINYLVAKAANLKRPLVINLSQGDNLGPHDGTSLLEKGIDGVLGQPGRAIVKSAGNCGSQGIHANFSMAPHGNYKLLFDVPLGDNSADSIDLWYSGSARLQVRLTTPGGMTTAPVAPPTSVPAIMALPNGNGAMIASVVSNPLNQDHQIYIQLLPGTFSYIQDGTWTIELSEQKGFSTEVDVWIEAGSPIPNFLGAAVTRQRTITVPGTSQEIITVGAHTTKFSTGVGAMPDFSSWGPCRKGIARPDLTAPGREIESADLTSSGGGAYIRREGTSAAAPHVAGAIALLFAEDPSLTQSQIRDYLIQTARTDAFTGAPPSIGWGAGKLDIDAACKAARAAKTT